MAAQPELVDRLKQAFLSYQTGQFAEAERLCTKVLAKQPMYFDARHLLGVISAAAGKREQAEKQLRVAIGINPGSAPALCNYGNVLSDLTRPAEALASYDKALAIRPDYAEALYNRGNALQALDRPVDALASYDRALAGKADYAEALCNRGNVLRELDRPRDALASYDRAIAIRPDYAEAWSNRGIALTELGRPLDALASCDRALAIRPDHADALSARGLALRDLARQPEALDSYDRALALRPDFADAQINKANVLRDIGRFEEAEAACRVAVTLRPDLPAAQHNLGNMLQDLGRVDEAEAYFREALRLNPNSAGTHSNLGMLLMLVGRLDEAWPEYEWRWRIDGMRGVTDRRDFVQPQWTGEPLGDRVLLVHAEQGFGDSLQFCRYVALLAASGARIVVEVPPALRRLVTSFAGLEHVVARGDPLPDFDLHCPMLSLPGAFRTTLATIPAAVPYLRADAGEAAVWRERLGALPGLRVGLVWAGNPRRQVAAMEVVDRRRSVTLDHLAPLADIAGVSFVSLQKGDGATQAARPPSSMALHDWTGELGDFADTAALIEGLDLVISVDTAVLHLAGALGKPVWLLNRFDSCWRWLRDRDDSPWYPTLRQFRQPSPGDWDSVVAAVRAALERCVAEGSPETR
ncbi:MAG TPA: tetratricopeptide repeat-containing glycosyltransferase family protein [Stellaceae bacterium]|nr:tetratricopeptide repeat-containing glycosyltransferase family protein [Stellaceae bacterium]